MHTTLSPEYYRQNYRRICDAALELGDIMLTNGAETHRVEDTICRILGTTGFSHVEAYVSLTGIVIGLNDASLDEGITLLKRITQRSNNMGRISLANDLSRRFVAGAITIEELFDEAKEIRTRTHYPLWLTALVYPLITAGFTLMFDGTPRDLLAALLVGLLLGLTRLGIQRLHTLWHLQEVLSAAALGCYVLLFSIIFPIAQNYSALLAGCIMPLVPGMMLTISFRDIVQGDYVSGLARMLEAIIVAVCVAVGMALVMMGYESLFGAIVQDTVIWQPFDSPYWIFFRYLLEAAGSFTASLTFCLLLNAEPKHLFWCGFTGAMAWLVYRFVGHYVDGFVLNHFLAAVTATLIAVSLSYRKKAPVTIFFTGGILCLVPGYKIYQTMFYFLGMELENGGTALLETLEIAALIAVAIAIHSSMLRSRKSKTLSQK